MSASARPNLAQRAYGLLTWALAPAVTLLVFVFLLAPLVVLMVYSLNSGRSTVVWEGFGVIWYAELFGDRRIGRTLWVSVLIAAGSAALAVAMGTLAGLVLGRHRFRGSGLIATLLAAPLVLPEIIMAVGLLVFVVSIGVAPGYGGLIAGHALVSLPFTVLIVRAATAALDPRFDEAAADLGATGWQTFVRITLPLVMPAVMVAFLLAATLSFDNLVMSAFMAGVGMTPLPIEIYSRLKAGMTPDINALGTLMVLFNLSVLLIAFRRYRALLLGGARPGAVPEPPATASA